MYVKLSEEELASIVKNYLLLDEELKNKEGFIFKLKIVFHDGSYEYDSYHSLDASYSYIERENIFGREVINRRFVSINYNQLEDILNTILEKEGKRIISSYYCDNAIGFNIEKLEQMKLKKEK